MQHTLRDLLVELRWVLFERPAAHPYAGETRGDHYRGPGHIPKDRQGREVRGANEIVDDRNRRRSLAQMVDVSARYLSGARSSGRSARKVPFVRKLEKVTLLGRSDRFTLCSDRGSQTGAALYVYPSPPIV